MQISRDSGKGEVQVDVSINTYLPLVMFFGLNALICTGFLVLSFFYLLFAKDAQIESNMFGYLIFSPLLICIALWFWQGVETAVLDGDKLKLIRSNGIIKISKTLQLCEVRDIKVAALTYPSDSFLDMNRQRILDHRRAIFSWNKMGKIELSYRRKTLTFFNGLSPGQALELLDLLNTELKERCNQNNRT